MSAPTYCETDGKYGGGGGGVGSRRSAPRSRKKSQRSDAGGDSPGSQPVNSWTSESLADGLEELSECGCKSPLLLRIRGLQNSLRDQIDENNRFRVKCETTEGLCQRLKEQLGGWSQASTFFEEEKAKLSSLIRRVGLGRTCRHASSIRACV